MTNKDKICQQLNDKEFITGTVLAERLGITRSFVSKSVKELQADGVQIITKRQHGYKFAEGYDYLNKKVIKENLKTKYIGSDIIILNSVESTNNYAKQLAKSEFTNGTIIISDNQTGGKGRMGRRFFSPHNFGLYYSVLLKPDISIELSQYITACAAVATAETIDKLGDTETQIKWVNDIYLGGKKLVGILTEASIGFEECSLDYVVIGIGINVFNVKKNLPRELFNVATSIEDETGIRLSRSILAAELSNNLEKHLDNMATGEFIETYRAKSCIMGKKVAVSRNGKEVIGTAIDIDDKASLVVQFDDGEILHLNSGEARIIPGQISTFC